MSVTENRKKLEAAIFSAFFNTFENGYAVEVTDVTDDYYGEDAEGVMFEILPKRNLLPWYEHEILLTLDIMEDAFTLLLDPQKHCEDEAEINSIAPRYLASATNATWQLKGLACPIEPQDDSEELRFYEDYAFSMHFIATVPLQSPDEFEQKLTALLGTLKEDSYVKDLAEILACYRADSVFDSWERLTFTWSDQTPEIEICGGDSFYEARLTVTKGGHPALYINNAKTDLLIPEIGAVRITHPTMLKKGSIAFLDADGFVLDAKHVLSIPVEIPLAPRYKKAALLLEEAFRNALPPLGVEIISSAR